MIKISGSNGGSPPRAQTRVAGVESQHLSLLCTQDICLEVFGNYLTLLFTQKGNKGFRSRSQQVDHYPLNTCFDLFRGQWRLVIGQVGLGPTYSHKTKLKNIYI